MTGCRVGAKNTLDRNYLYLAEKRSAEVQAETEVNAVRPRSGGGYVIETTTPRGRSVYTSDQVVLAGGVMGSVPLLLAMREDADGLPRVSPRVGDFVRTNGEALMGVLSLDSNDDHSIGITITSILQTNENTHIEPVRYGAGSDFFRLFILPHSSSASALGRLAGALWSAVKSPWRWARAVTIPQFARRSIILMYMSGVDEGINLRLGRSALTGYRRRLVSVRNEDCATPSASMPEAHDLARRLAEKLKGVRVTLLHEMLLGASTTAHILGGARMGRGAEDGVIDARHRVFGYDGMYVIDASAVSANPGINHALTIAALAERAMSFIPAKS